MAVNRAVEAILDAQIAMAQAGYQLPEMTVNDRCYWSALVACDPDVHRPRQGARQILVLAELAPAPGESSPALELPATHQVWLTPEQEREFVFHGPQGEVRGRRSGT